MENLVIEKETHHYNDALAKVLIKYQDTPLLLVRHIIGIFDEAASNSIISWNLTDPEYKNFKDAKKTILDAVIDVKTSAGNFKIDIEVQSYRSDLLMIRIKNYSRALGANDFISLTTGTENLPTNIQVWMLEHNNGIKFNGRKCAVLDLSDIETHERYAFGDKYVLVNGEYYAHLPDSFEPENAFDAFMRFFAISNNQKLEEFVQKNYHHFDFLKNLLERQKKFFENPDDVKIYMDREFELKELQARDEAIRKANDRAEKAEAEIKAKDAEIAKIKDEADKAKAELAQAKADFDAKMAEMQANIDRLKAGQQA